MISRVARARHVCLSCRFGVSQRAVALSGALSTQRDLGRRSFASAQDVSKDEILDALMSGRRTVGNKAGKREKLPSWGIATPKTSKPKPARATTARHTEAKNEPDEMRPIWEGMEKQAASSRKPKQEPKTSRLGFDEQEQKHVSTEPINDDLSRFLREAGVSQEAEDAPEVPEDPVIQDNFEDLSTDLESRELPESSESSKLNETIETDETEDQQQPPERTIGRSFSDEDFSYWATDKNKKSPNGQTSKEDQTKKPYMVGRTRLDRQSVGLGALGQKFDALVMNDPDALGRKERLGPSQSQLPPSIALDPQTFAVDDSNMEPDEEAFHNLDTLRPTMSSTLTRHEFESLRNLLAEGFNGSQLVLYWQRHRDPEAKPAEPSAAYPWLKDLGTWKPVDDEVFQASVEKKAKSSYANRIMTQVWGLQIQEEVEMPGRVTVRLPAMPHALISNPNLGFLETIKAEILDETLGENITSTEGGKKTLTIIARKPVVPVILARIDVVLNSLDKQEISLGGVPRDLIKREYLNELERVTRAIIMQSAPDSPTLDVCWPRDDEVDEAESALERETPADTVRRLLLGRHVAIGAAEEQIVAKRFRGEGVAAKAGTLTPYHRETRSMSWKDRLAPWARFIIPAPAELKKVRWLKLPDRVALPHMDSASESGKDLLTATFGHILHAPLPKPKTRGRSKETYRRTLSPVMPHPAAFTDLLPKENHHIIKKSSIVVHFVPAPGATAGATAPALKLTMPFTGQEDFSTFALPKKSILQAPRSSFVKDILFPEEMVDARVERSCDLELDIEEQSAFQDFMNASEFNAAGILQTPKGTRFSIPRTWLSKPGKKAAKEDTVNLPYLFGGLEVRQTLDLPWQDNISVRYESIEAGQHGGTRQELSLVLDLATLGTSKVQSSVREFLWKLGDVVEGKFWSWSQGVAKLKDLPPNADEMINKMRQRPAPKRSKAAAAASIEQELLEEELFDESDEPGAPIQDFENEVAFEDGIEEGSAVDVSPESGLAPRSEVIDWSSAPMAPSSEYSLDSSVVNAVAEFEQMLMDETGSIAPAEEAPIATDDAQIETNPSSALADDLTSATGADPHATASSADQTSTGPFSPTSPKQKDHPKRSRRQKVLEDDDFEDVDEMDSDVEEYEAMSPEALRAKMEAEAGGASLAELYRRAGATPEQMAALEEESKKFEKEWKDMHERLPSDEEEPRSREEVEAEDKMLKQFLAEDIARIEEEDRLTEEELGDEDDNAGVNPAEEKRKKKLRKRRG